MLILTRIHLQFYNFSIVVVIKILKSANTDQILQIWSGNEKIMRNLLNCGLSPDFPFDCPVIVDFLRNQTEREREKKPKKAIIREKEKMKEVEK